MTDSPESPCKPLSGSSTNPRLQYPTLPPLNASVEEWLSRSRPTDMTSHAHPEPQPKSLTESWATLSASDAHSEDGAPSEQTDMGSLIDPTGPDDVASLDDRYTSSEVDGQEDEDEDEDKSSDSECQDLPPLFHHAGDAIDDSNLTTKPLFHQTTDSIEFSEPERWPEAEHVELKHTVKVFEGEEASELKERLPYNLVNSILVASVQQTMTRQSLSIDKPFHVLYVGNSEFRNIILDKIGDVLVSCSGSSFESSSTESSRYHVVPTSFGAGAVPNFAELLPIHVQLVVDECIGATSGPQTDKPCTIDLHFKNRPPCTSSWTGSDYRVSSSTEWTSPDMAVLFISSGDDSAAVKTQMLARTFMERLGVPVMVISERPLWKMTTELIPVNHHSLHMCLESRHPLTGVSVVLRRYPIDMNTFESITPNQLNRNLASLVSIYSKKTYKATPQQPQIPDRKWFSDMEKYPLNMLPFSPRRAREVAPVLRLLTLTIISAIAVSLGISALKIVVVFLLQCFTAPGTSDLASSAVGGQAPSSVLPFEGLKQASVSAVPDSMQSLIHQLDGQSKVEQLMGLGVGHERDGSRFEIRVLGDCHVIIKPPQEFVTRRKRPSFEVKVCRYNEALPYELSKLFEGVYTLKLEREDAYGLLNVSISTPRPPLTQITELDFGTPWLKIANWKRAAQVISSQLTKDLTAAQTTALEVYGRLHKDLQALMGDVVTKSHSLRPGRGQLRRDALQLSQAAGETILSRSKQLSEMICRDTLPRLQAASSALQGHSEKVNQEAKELVSNTWNRVTAWARTVDVNAMTENIRNVQPNDILDMAQKRARSLLGRETCERQRCSRQGGEG